MNMVMKRLAEIFLIPVIEIDDVQSAPKLADALIKGGLPCAEVTFRTQAAEEAIRVINQEYPQMLVGAGTILTIDQVDRAVNAGAKFVVSPGFDSELVDYCIENNIMVFPGIVTPSEASWAVKRGLEVVKFFPAEQFGGVATIKALAGPYPMLKFMPSGGVNASNLKDYLACDKVFGCGGSWMVKRDFIRNGQYEKITEMTKEAVSLVKSIRG